MKTVAIAGASGYVGGELLRLIAAHPELTLVAATANSNAGSTIGWLHPHLAEFADVVLLETKPENLVAADIVFLALPHTTSAEVASWLADDTLVLDCGARQQLGGARFAGVRLGGLKLSCPFGVSGKHREHPGEHRSALRDREVAAPGARRRPRAMTRDF